MSALKIIIQFPGGNRILYSELPTTYWDLLSFMQHNISCNVDNYSKYWIDNEKDLIQINNQASYKMFLQLSNNKKLFLTTEEKPEQQKKINIEVQSNTKIDEMNSECDIDKKPLTIHSEIVCSNCKITPIVGFRYKCQHCEDYDLCMKCESNYVHRNHKMLRLPDEFLKSSRKRKRRSKTNVSESETTESVVKDELEYENKKDDITMEKIKYNHQLKTTVDTVKNELNHENKTNDIIKEKFENVCLLSNDSTMVENNKMKKSNENMKNNFIFPIQSDCSKYNLNLNTKDHLENYNMEATRRKLEQLRFNKYIYKLKSNNIIRENQHEQFHILPVQSIIYIIVFFGMVLVYHLCEKLTK